MDSGKKIIVQLDMHDDKGKQKAMQAISGLSGLESISADMKEKKLTVVGDVDPVCVISKLRKCGRHASIVSVGPAKDPKEEEKKKKEAEEKKKKEEAAKKKKEAEEAEKKRIEECIAAAKFCPPYPPYPPCPPCPPPYYYVRSCDENPNSCTIL